MRLKQTLIVIALVCSFVALWFTQDSLLEQKDAHGLSATSPFEGLQPGEFAGTVLLGGFRNIAIDISWMKSIKLQEEQDYYKLLAVYQTIANLQPNVPVVWEFNASNMIFNLSALALTKDEEERWVRRGIDFLKAGIEKNPRTYRLYNSLAYAYTSKVARKEHLTKSFLAVGEGPYQEAAYYLEKACAQKDAPAPAFSQRIHALVQIWKFDEAEKLVFELLRDWPDWISAGIVYHNRFEDFRYPTSVAHLRNMRIYTSWKEME